MSGIVQPLPFAKNSSFLHRYVGDECLIHNFVRLLFVHKLTRNSFNPFESGILFNCIGMIVGIQYTEHNDSINNNNKKEQVIKINCTISDFVCNSMQALNRLL